jgi:hypothetical protein
MWELAELMQISNWNVWNYQLSYSSCMLLTAKQIYNDVGVDLDSEYA